MRDLLRAIEKRSRPVADIEQGHISTDQLHPRQPRPEPRTHPGLGRDETGRHRRSGRQPAARRDAYRKPWVHPKP
jgi:hypothetical protein